MLDEVKGEAGEEDRSQSPTGNAAEKVTWGVA